MLSFCVDPKGDVAEPVTDASSGPREFERAAYAALARWKYAPARLNGDAIETCLQRVMLQFRLAPAKREAQPDFVGRWRVIHGLIASGQLDEASARLDRIMPWNNYESARASLLGAEIARARGDARAELQNLRVALLLPEYLEPPLLISTMRRAFAVEVHLGHFADALSTYQKLVQDPAASLTKEERKVGQQLIDTAGGSSVIREPMILDQHLGADNEASLTWLTLLRREFAFTDVTPGVERFELRCDAQWYRSSTTSDKSWKVPESWGKCRLFVFGASGATVNVLEYAQGEPAPPAPAGALQ